MGTSDREAHAQQISDLFLDFTDRFLVSHIAVPEPLKQLLTRPGRPSGFAGIDAFQYEWYRRFGRHEWEVDFFRALAEYWEVIAATVLVPVARDLAQDEIKKGYRWVREKVVDLIDRIQGKYQQQGVTARGDIQRFDEMKEYINRGLELLERTGFNDFTTTEFARLANVDEQLVGPLLILCQFHEEGGRWRRKDGGQ